LFIDCHCHMEMYADHLNEALVDLENNQIIVNAGRENKAALIGRNKRRLLEMKKIIEDFFGKEFRIV